MNFSISQDSNSQQPPKEFNINSLGKLEAVFFRKLYFCPCEKKLVFGKSGTFADIYNKLGHQGTTTHKYLFLKKMLNAGFLFSAGKPHQYFIDKQRIKQELSHDKLFILDHAIIEDEAVLIDDFPKISQETI